MVVKGNGAAHSQIIVEDAESYASGQDRSLNSTLGLQTRVRVSEIEISSV